MQSKDKKKPRQASENQVHIHSNLYQYTGLQTKDEDGLKHLRNNSVEGNEIGAYEYSNILKVGEQGILIPLEKLEDAQALQSIDLTYF